MKINSFIKHKLSIKRFLFGFCFYIYENIKSFIRLIIKIFCFFLKKTININNLIKRGDASSKLIFKEEIYNLKQSRDINNKKFKYLPVGKYKIPNYNIFTISNGIVKAGTNNIFSKDGRQITGINFQDLTFDCEGIFPIRDIDSHYFNKSLVVLGVGALEANYSHAWTELAARAYAIKLSEIKYDKILIDKETKFIKEILKLIGLQEDKIIFSNNYRYIKARKLIYPEMINNFKQYFINGIFVYHRKFLPSWINYLYEDVSRKVYGVNLNYDFEKIYISRRNKLEREITNEKELIIYLKKKGFKVIYFEDYSIYEQINIMKCARQVIAIHGAGLVNINFCKKGTKILELFPFYYQCAFFYMHSNMLNIDYDFYIGKPVNKLWRRSPIMENFYVEIPKIDKFLKENWQ